jgi:hypothetical protein
VRATIARLTTENDRSFRERPRALMEGKLRIAGWRQIIR